MYGPLQSSPTHWKGEIIEYIPAFAKPSSEPNEEACARLRKLDSFAPPPYADDQTVVGAGPHDRSERRAVPRPWPMPTSRRAWLLL